MATVHTHHGEIAGFENVLGGGHKSGLVFLIQNELRAEPVLALDLLTAFDPDGRMVAGFHCAEQQASGFDAGPFGYVAHDAVDGIEMRLNGNGRAFGAPFEIIIHDLLQIAKTRALDAGSGDRRSVKRN